MFKKSAQQIFSSKSLSLIAVLLIVFVVYLPSLFNGFVSWDDDVHLLNNLSVRSLDKEHIADIFTSRVNNVYIPLTVFSFALEYNFVGYNPFLYHFDNLLLHLIVVSFIFLIGLRLGLSTKFSALAALIFGIHPIHVESVAWVTERKDCLYAAFYMAAVWAYSGYLNVKSDKNSKKESDVKKIKWLALTCVLGFLSILAKPMALSLPLILILMDWFYGRKLNLNLLKEKIVLFVLLGSITWITYSAHVRNPIADIKESFLIWPWSFSFYLRQFTFPWISVPVYRLPKPIDLFQIDYLASVLVLICIVYSIIRFKEKRMFIFAMLFYFFSIFFLLRFDETKDINIVADRFMYLPSVGLCLWIAYFLEKFFAKKRNTSNQRILTIGCIALLIAFSFQTLRQTTVWKNGFTLWQHQLKFFPNEPIALNNLANLYRDSSEYKKAEEEYRKILNIKAEGYEIKPSPEILETIQRVEYVILLYQRAAQIDPTYIDAHFNLGKMYKDLNLIPQAIQYYLLTLNLDPKYKDVYFGLGDLYRDIDQKEKAITFYEKALSLFPKDGEIYFNLIKAYTEILEKTPDDQLYQRARQRALEGYIQLINSQPPSATSYFNLGTLYGEMKDYERALSAYQMSLDINPTYNISIYNKSNILRELGRLDEALAGYEKVVLIDPKLTDAYINIGIIYQKQGAKDKAKEYFLKAAKRDSSSAKAYFNLGYIEESLGNLTKAAEYYNAALNIEPTHAETHYNLGNVYTILKNNKKALEHYLKAIELNPKHLNALVNASIISFKEKKYKEAVKYCDEAVLLGYDAPLSYLKALEPYR